MGVWDALFQWKAVHLSHPICNSREFGNGTPHHCKWMASSPLNGWKCHNTPEMKARCEAFFSCWSYQRKCSGAEECLGWTAPGFSLAKHCSSSGCPFGDRGRDGAVFVFVPVPRQFLLGRSAEVPIHPHLLCVFRLS